MAISRNLLVLVLAVICTQAVFGEDGPMGDRPMDGGPMGDKPMDGGSWGSKDPCQQLLQHIKFLTYKLEKLTNQVHKIPFDLFESKRFFQHGDKKPGRPDRPMKEDGGETPNTARRII